MALLNGGNNFCGVDDREHAKRIFYNKTN